MVNTKKVGGRIAFVAAVLALTLAPAALAKGPGGGGASGGGGSLSLVMVNDKNGNGAPNWGDTITFNVSTTATSQPYVSLNCYQGSTLVYSASAGFYPSYAWPYLQDFVLSSNSWTGGPASCTATLSYSNGRKWVTLATLPVSVQG